MCVLCLVQNKIHCANDDDDYGIVAEHTEHWSAIFSEMMYVEWCRLCVCVVCVQCAI